MANLQKLNVLLNKFLTKNNINFNEKLWRIDNSSLGGRGLFANRDIEENEIIFIDHPILIGPRASKNIQFYCVICYNLKIRACTNGCGLPLCSTNCENSSLHMKECKLIKILNKNKLFSKISTELFRGLFSLRSFLLGENSYKLIKYFVSHKNNHHFEIELIKSQLKLEENEEMFLKAICSIFDLNVFEIIVYEKDKQISLRALYSVASFMNHSCTPNTNHLFNNKQEMIVKASMAISKDSEIFTNYTSIFWGTTSRRHHLASTKHFWCYCSRCKDPKEFGTGLGGLKCISKQCQGVLYPLQSLNILSKWKCDVCQLLIESQKIGIIQSSLGGLLKTIDVSDLGKLIIFLKERLGNVVPLKNQIAIEIKCKIIWCLGYTEGYLWNDLSDEHLIFKEQLCREVLQLLTDLKVGQTSLRGLFLYELYRCLNEKSLRISLTKDIQDIENFEVEGQNYLQEAVVLLKDDVAAPSEIKSIISDSQYV